jgi:hypothetical protein
MKTTLLAMLLIAATAVLSGPTSDDVVEAAKAAKAKRKKSTTRVITNADLKKAKSTLIENKLPALPADAIPDEGLLEKQAREKKERAASEVALAAAKKTVADFEREVALLEQQYYEENDLDKRDKELVRRFNAAKAKLDAAKKDLEALMPPETPIETIE